MKWFEKTKISVWMSVATIALMGSRVEADFIFSEPMLVPHVNSEFSDGALQVSRDGLELYLSRVEEGGIHKIYVSKRATTNDPWSTPERIDAAIDPAWEAINPSLSADGLELYFADGQAGNENPNGYGGSDIWVLTRLSKEEPWTGPINLGPTINSANTENTPCKSNDGLALYFSSVDADSGKGAEIVVSTRSSKADPWGEPVALGSNVNSALYEYTPFISADGLTLFFSRGFLATHIYVSQRQAVGDPWGPAVFFDPASVDGPAADSAEYNVSYANDSSTIYFTRGTNAFTLDWNEWQVEVTPMLDFNGDTLIDLADVLMLIDSWQTDNSLFDVAPMPLGDGIVDAKDLRALADHMVQNETAPE